MSFVALERGATSLTVDVPPKIVDRDGRPDSPQLVIRWELLEGDQVDDVRTLLGDAGRGAVVSLSGQGIVTEWPGASAELGLVTVKLTPSGSTFLCMFGPPEEQGIEPLMGDYPDSLANGSAQLASRLRCSVQLVLYRM